MSVSAIERMVKKYAKNATPDKKSLHIKCEAHMVQHFIKTQAT